MSIPEGVETVTVSSGVPMTLPDGTLIRGHIRFVAPDLNLIDDEDFIFGGESTAELCHGEFSITLVAPDATGITPTGWTYTAIGEFVNAPDWTRYIDITKANPNVFLDDVIVLTPGDITNPDTTFVRKAGDTMTGPLILDADPTAALGAATKQYVDSAVPDTSDFVDKDGDTMLGELVLFGDPTVALGAAPKQYVDQAEADAVTAATAAAAAESVSLSGDTMTGPLILSGAPATGLGAATKTYVDAGDDARVAVAGDTMTGELVLFGDPTVALGAAPKQYVDAAQAAAEATAAAESVSLSGDTMTGALVLSADPVVALGAATKQYAEQVADAAEAAAAAESVSIAGDTMTGFLTLHANPNLDLHAATKQYVDGAQAAAEAASAAESVSLTGDTMTGALVLSGDPTVANGAANKNYVDNLDVENVKLTGAQTVNGVKTFGSIPVLPGSDPVAANEATRKSYVDALDAANVKLTGTQSIAGLKTFTDAVAIEDGADVNLLTVEQTNALANAGVMKLIAGQATQPAFLGTYQGAATNSWAIRADGRYEAGDGTLARDAFIARIAAGVWQVTSQIRVTGAAPSDAADLTRKDYVDGLDAQNVKLTGAQTVAGVKTFSSIPVGPASNPTTDNELARKAYVDASIPDTSDFVNKTDAQTVNGIKTFGSIPVLPTADPTTDDQAARKAYVDAGDATVQASVDALDSAVVKLTGDQTVNGIKTFGSIPLGPASDPTTVNQLTRKSYVDAGDAAVQANVDTVAGDLATLDGEVVKTSGAQTIAGVKTFSSTPVGPTADPTTDDQLARKAYVDAGDAANASDIATLDGEVVKITGAQTVAGVKTFSSIPVLPASDPTVANEATRKSYVDTLDGANVKLTGAQTVAGVKTFSSIPVGPASDPTTDNEFTRKFYVDAGDSANASDIATLDGEVVKLTGDQAVAGIKTFSSIPLGPASDPTTDNQLTRKLYVDNGDAAVQANVDTVSGDLATLDAAVVKLTGDQAVAGIKTFSSIPILPASNPTADNQATRKLYVDTLDGANVKLTGAQSISGVKTFSSGIDVTAGLGSDRFEFKATDTARASTTTPAADPHLAVSVEANAVYVLEANCVWTQGGGGFRIDFTAPASAEMVWTDNDGFGILALGTDNTFSTTTGATMKGAMRIAGTAGTVTLRWAQNTSNAADTTLKEGSYLWLRRVA